MDGYKILGFFGTLRECKKAISNTWKHITVITTVSILLDSLLLLSTKSCTKTTTSDSLSRSTPNSTNLVNSFEKIKKDVQILIAFEFLSLLPFLAIYLLSLVTVILATTIAYRIIKNFSFEDFLSRIPKLCLTTLFGSFHLILFMIGYISLFSALLISLMIVPMDHLLVLIPIMVTFGLIAFIFWMYFAFILDIAFVISVIEYGGCGLQAAQEKAKALVKENRLHRILQILSFIMGLLTVIICAVMLRGNPHQKPIWTQIIHELFSKVFYIMMAIVYFRSCTQYLQCKKTQGEEIELQGSLEDGRIRNHSSTGANWKCLPVMLLFAVVIFLLWNGIWYWLIFQSRSSDHMFNRIFASRGS